MPQSLSPPLDFVAKGGSRLTIATLGVLYGDFSGLRWHQHFRALCLALLVCQRCSLRFVATCPRL